MRVAFGIACSKILKNEPTEFLLPLESEDRPTNLVCPVSIWEGKPEELRKRLHGMVDAIIDRSCFESDNRII